MDKEIRRNSIIKLIIGVVLLTLGVITLIYSTHNITSTILGYIIGALICITSIFLIIYTFIKYPEHVYRYLIFSLLLTSGVYCFIIPLAATTFICLFIGITLMLCSLLYVIKFIILKHLTMRYWFNVVQLIVCIVLFGLGVSFAIFYNTIDTFLICMIVGIPLSIIGLFYIILMSIRLIANR